jgi:hypothetical protein
MHRIRLISRPPRQAAGTIPLDDVLQFLVDIIEIILPLTINKNPENPEPPDTSGD